MSINKFKGNYSFLSNFYPCYIEYEGEVYPSVEHAFQAAKTNNEEQRLIIRITESAKEVKGYGKKVDLREDWESVKLSIMKFLLMKKFTWCEEIKNKLLNTGNEELIEGNTWNDTYWGVCNGIGENNLGKLLMEVREEIRSSI